MKSFIYILLTSLTFLVVGCQNESEEIRLINQAERLFDAYPDSVITTLDSIQLPEEMSPRLIARWCMLYARAADKIEDEMPYTNQLEIALKYYQKKKMREEEAEIGLYLGRSYVEDKEYEKAMRAYSDALEVALAIKNYNRAGYICSYMGDLYELDDRYVLAAKKYKESGRYFRLAGNMKSYVRSFVNEGRSYMDVDSNYLALTILKRAEVIIDSLRGKCPLCTPHTGCSRIICQGSQGAWRKGNHRRCRQATWATKTADCSRQPCARHPTACCSSTR